MSLASFLLATLYRLPRRTNGVRATRDIAVRAPDGVALMTDHYAPDLPGKHPTMLMRAPYGRRGFGTVCEAFAERGFNVVLQACRGTDSSGGEFDPLRHEREDGLAALEWIKAQDWFDGRLGTTGPSYLGYAQWAISDALPAHSAMSIKVSSAEFRSVAFPNGAFHLQLWLSWLQVVDGIRRAPMEMSRRMMTGDVERRTETASMILPLVEADEFVTGRRVPFWRRWFDSAVEDGPFWEEIDHRHRLGPGSPPNHFVSGWYDIMIDQLLRDYSALAAVSGKHQLTVGPWIHTAGELQAESMRQTIPWMRAHLAGDRSGLREKPVKLYVMGLERWREFDAWPPPGGTPLKLHLGGEGTLAAAPPPELPASRYTYDPAEPTPNLGGAIFAFAGAGPRDNRPLEKRADVLGFTSVPLSAPLTVIGNAEAVLFVRSSLEHTDFFVRLCGVAPNGKSTNICDGLTRLTPGSTEADADGVRKVTVRLHATAHSFRPGHAIRVLVASGAHPRFARNLGTDEPIGVATRMAAAEQEIFHDPARPSAVTLPVCEVT